MRANFDLTVYEHQVEKVIGSQPFLLAYIKNGKLVTHSQGFCEKTAKQLLPTLLEKPSKFSQSQIIH